MVESEMSTNNMTALIYPDHGQFRAIWRCNGVGSNTTAYLRNVANHVNPFMTTVYPCPYGYFQQGHAPFHKAQIIANWFRNLTMSSFYSSNYHSHSQSGRTPLCCLLWEIHSIDLPPTNLQQLCDGIVWIVSAFTYIKRKSTYCFSPNWIWRNLTKVPKMRWLENQIYLHVYHI